MFPDGGGGVADGGMCQLCAGLLCEVISTVSKNTQLNDKLDGKQHYTSKYMPGNVNMVCAGTLVFSLDPNIRVSLLKCRLIYFFELKV